MPVCLSVCLLERRWRGAGRRRAQGSSSSSESGPRELVQQRVGPRELVQQRDAKCRLTFKMVHLVQARCGHTWCNDGQLLARVRPTLKGQWWQDSKLGFQVHFPVAVSAPRGIHPLGHRPLRRAKTPHAGNTPSASPIRPSYPQEAPVEVDPRCDEQLERRAVDSSRKRTTP